MLKLGFAHKFSRNFKAPIRQFIHYDEAFYHLSWFFVVHSFIVILCCTWVLSLDCVVISISFLLWFCFLLDSLSLTTKPELLISYYTRTVFTTKIWTVPKNQCLFKFYIYVYLMYYVYWLTVIDYIPHCWTGIYVLTVVSSCGTLLPSDAWIMQVFRL